MQAAGHGVEAVTRGTCAASCEPELGSVVFRMPTLLAVLSVGFEMSAGYFEGAPATLERRVAHVQGTCREQTLASMALHWSFTGAALAAALGACNGEAPSDGIEYATVRIAGNSGQALPLAEYPWPGVEICDEIQYGGVCAAGTDPDCIPNL